MAPLIKPGRQEWAVEDVRPCDPTLGSESLSKQPGVQTPELEGTIPTTGTPSRAAGHVQTVGTTFQLFLSRAERGVSGLE